MNNALYTSAIEEISIKTARPFIEKWHYSKCVPTGKNIFFGWFVLDDACEKHIYAIANYGIGVNPYQAKFLARKTNKNVTNDTLLELKRLCRTEPKNKKLPLTFFISRCHKLLKQRKYSYIVSFSDPTYGHDGGIYKAANFIHLGTTNPEYHTIDKNGNIRHRRYAFRYARRNNVTISQARKKLGLEKYKTQKKDRWFISL